MLAPAGWAWSFYEITHFNMLDFTRQCQDHYDLKTNYVHKNKATTMGGWEHSKFKWLTKADDKKFAFLGPAMGCRSVSSSIV